MSFVRNINIQFPRRLYLDLQRPNRRKIAPRTIAIDDSPRTRPTKLMAKKARSISERSSTAAPSVRQKTPSVRNMNLAFSFNRMIFIDSKRRHELRLRPHRIAVSNLRATDFGLAGG